MHAFDSRYPEVQVPANLFFRVTRNENTPIFSSGSYQFEIDETVMLGNSIGQVFATDRDVLVCFYLNKANLFLYETREP